MCMPPSTVRGRMRFHTVNKSHKSGNERVTTEHHPENVTTTARWTQKLAWNFFALFEDLQLKPKKMRE